MGMTEKGAVGLFAKPSILPHEFFQGMVNIKAKTLDSFFGEESDPRLGG